MEYSQWKKILRFGDQHIFMGIVLLRDQKNTEILQEKLKVDLTLLKLEDIWVESNPW